MSAPEQLHTKTYPTEQLVADYRTSRSGDPLLYPGERPDNSYLTDGTAVYDIQVSLEDDVLAFTMQSSRGSVPINEFLREHGAAPMEDRIPVLAYGANMSPGALGSKFTKIGREDATIVPTIYAALPGHDVVWSGGPGVSGNFIAILYQGEETQETTVNVGVNFLTREQLLVMHATELAYDLNTVELVVEGKPIKAYYYSGMDSVFLADGKPVAVDAVPALGRGIASANTKEMLEDVLDNAAIMDEVAKAYPVLTAADVAHYIENAEEMKAVPVSRLALKKFVHAAIASLGMSKIVDSSHALHTAMNWANPSMLPTYGEQLAGVVHHNRYRLPSEEIPLWEDADARRKVLRALSAHTVRMSGGQLVHEIK